MKELKDILFPLSAACGAGAVCEAAELALRMLSPYMECERGAGLTVIGKMPGKSDRTLMLEAHLDEVSMIVTEVDDNGFLTVAKCGGIDLRALPSRPVTVHGKQPVPAVFCSTPPHLASGGETEYDDISVLKIDTMLGAKAKEIVSVGDTVTFRAEPAALCGSRVTGKSFDDRAGVACLISLAERLAGKELPMNLVFVLSDQEELGMRGAKTAAFSADPQEAIALDVSFGDAPDVSDDDCGRLSGGAMVGVSPVLDTAISRKLCRLAKENGIPFQQEVMGSRTGTDSDVISVTAGGVPTGLISIPLRNMHTDVEVIDLNDLDAVCRLLEAYILSGGVLDA